jgi:hypothetical protein
MTAKEYNTINELLSEYSSLNAELERAEAEIKKAQLDSARELLPKHAELSVRFKSLEDKLRAMSDAHYDELFPTDDKRNHKTPFGELTYRKSTSIEPSDDDEEKALLKLKVECSREATSANKEQRAPRFTEAQLIRAFEKPNLDTLAALDDATLALLGFNRVHADNFKIKPFSMKTDKPAKSKSQKLKEAA